jgi:hypothetical protein
MNKFNNDDDNNRSVVGYDLREKLFGDAKGNWFALTIDMQLWKEHSKKYTLCIDVNGFNFLSRIENFLFEIEDSCLIAIDIPTEMAIRISSTFGIHLFPLTSLSKEWIFLGFDIADIRTQSSALYSFDSSFKIEIKKKIIDYNINLNKYGLVNSQSDSIVLSNFFDVLISSHAPFVPCGIWLSSHSTNKFHS